MRAKITHALLDDLFFFTDLFPVSLKEEIWNKNSNRRFRVVERPIQNIVMQKTLPW